jgi:uncharacterized membrane protein
MKLGYWHLLKAAVGILEYDYNAISIDVNDWIESKELQSKSIWQNFNSEHFATDYSKWNTNIVGDFKNNVGDLADELLKIITHKQFNYRAKQSLQEILQVEKYFVF